MEVVDMFKKVDITVNTLSESHSTLLRIGAKRVRDQNERVRLIAEFLASYNIISVDFSRKKMGVFEVIEKNSEVSSKQVVIINDFVLPRISHFSKNTIFEILKGDITVLSMNFQNNFIDDDEAIKLAESLVYNKSLKFLNLKGNTIGLRGARALAELLKYNKTLIELDLNGNSIPMLGLHLIGLTLQKNTTLKMIDLRNKYSSISRVKPIVKAAKLNKTLAQLNYM